MTNQKRILITGASGFVGNSLAQWLSKNTQYQLCLAARNFDQMTTTTYHKISKINDINSTTDWTDALTDCDIVIHTAARVHIMNDTTVNTLDEFRKINVEGTLNLARQAIQHGVRRFIFISSIKVNGEITSDGKKFVADALPAPQDNYAISKYEAEQGLLHLSNQGLEVVIIRPPLIYGPGVKGNLLRLVNYLDKGYPLPIGRLTKNKRSYLSIINLNNLIEQCINHPNASNQIFLASDNNDLSTRELVSLMIQSRKRPLLLLPIPLWILKTAMYLLGKRDIWQRIGCSLEIDLSKTLEILDWKPIISTGEAIKLMD